MKKLIFIFMGAAWLFGAIQWESDFQTAYKKALEEKKPLFVFMQRLSPPCRWCEKMKHTTLHDANISNTINQRFIALKVTRENRDYPASLYSQYVPAIFIIDPATNKIITRIIGYWDVQDFQSDLDYIFRLLHR